MVNKETKIQKERETWEGDRKGRKNEGREKKKEGSRKPTSKQMNICPFLIQENKGQKL